MTLLVEYKLFTSAFFLCSSPSAQNSAWHVVKCLIKYCEVKAQQKNRCIRMKSKDGAGLTGKRLDRQ